MARGADTADKLGERLRAALRLAPASVTIVTAGNGPDALGMTATAVAPVTLDPPALLVCVNAALRLHHLIRATGRFRISYLTREQESVARAFGGGLAGHARFRVGDWDLHAPSGPALAAPLATMACALQNAVDCGAHSVFIGRVESVFCPGGAPLLYCDGAYAGLRPDGAATNMELRSGTAPCTP